MGFMIRHIAATWEIALMAHQCAGNRQVTLLVRWRAEMENRTDIIQSTTGHCSSSRWECCCHDPSTSQFDGMCLLAWYCIPYNKPSILWCWHNPCALHVWPIQWIYLAFYLECHFTTECCRQNLWRKLYHCYVEKDSKLISFWSWIWVSQLTLTFASPIVKGREAMANIPCLYVLAVFCSTWIRWHSTWQVYSHIALSIWPLCSYIQKEKKKLVSGESSNARVERKIPTEGAWIQTVTWIFSSSISKSSPYSLEYKQLT